MTVASACTMAPVAAKKSRHSTAASNQVDDLLNHHMLLTSDAINGMRRNGDMVVAATVKNEKRLVKTERDVKALQQDNARHMDTIQVLERNNTTLIRVAVEKGIAPQSLFDMISTDEPANETFYDAVEEEDQFGIIPPQTVVDKVTGECRLCKRCVKKRDGTIPPPRIQRCHDHWPKS